jgi:hypothetical protein
LSKCRGGQNKDGAMRGKTKTSHYCRNKDQNGLVKGKGDKDKVLTPMMMTMMNDDV